MNLGGGLMAAPPAPGSALRLQFERGFSLDSPAPGGAYADSQGCAALPDPLDAPLPPSLGDAGFGYSQQDGLFWCARWRPERTAAEAAPALTRRARRQHARLHHAARCAAGVRVCHGGKGACTGAPRRGRDSWCRRLELSGAAHRADACPGAARAGEPRHKLAGVADSRQASAARCVRGASWQLHEPSAQPQRSARQRHAPAHR